MARHDKAPADAPLSNRVPMVVLWGESVPAGRDDILTAPFAAKDSRMRSRMARFGYLIESGVVRLFKVPGVLVDSHGTAPCFAPLPQPWCNWPSMPDFRARAALRGRKRDVWCLAARIVLLKRQATVMGPTPPGTGVIAEA